jgi:hypothetical protein
MQSTSRLCATASVSGIPGRSPEEVRLEVAAGAEEHKQARQKSEQAAAETAELLQS